MSLLTLARSNRRSPRSRRALARVAVAVTVAAALLLVGSSGLAVSGSLRSEQDVADLADTFMRNMVENDVKSAYRVVAQFWPLGMPTLAEQIAEQRARRTELRRTLGLSLGYEHVVSEAAGDRVTRITHLERFDNGALVWRFVFYRADTSWQLVGLSTSEDLGVLFPAP